MPFSVCAAQILTKAGVLNVPDWWEAGRVSAEQTGIPTREYLQQLKAAAGSRATGRESRANSQHQEQHSSCL